VVVIGLLIFWSSGPFAAAGRRVIFLITVRAVNGDQLARARLWLVHDLVVGSILALLLIFIVNALIFVESKPQQKDQPKAAPADGNVFAALANTAVLMSLFIYFYEREPDEHHRHHGHRYYHLAAVGYRRQEAAFGLIMGNVAGALPRHSLPARDFAPHARLSLYRRVVFRSGFRRENRSG
jgi:hypothetical protein